MTDSDVLAKRLLALCGERGLMLATAESCTGGLVAGALTAIPGSSTVFERGFVTYSNEAKTDMLGVKQSTLAEFGAVSRETAAEMAQGALHRSRADVAVSVTGIAGPGGGSVEKPVGLIWFGVAGKAVAASAASRQFPSDSRDVIRGLAVVTALDLLIAALLPGQTGPAAP